MLKIIDRYILKKFLGTFFLIITLILAIAVVFDISEKIDNFVQEGASAKEIIFDYYLNFIVYYGNLFSSMMVFISTIFFTSRMAGNTEIVAILTGGVSFRRMMWPFFVGATVIAVISFLLGNYVIPKTNVYRINFETTYISSKGPDRFKNVHRQIEPGHIIYFDNFNTEKNSGYRFSYEVFENHSLKAKLKSDFIELDTTAGQWALQNWHLRTIDAEGNESIRAGQKMDTVLNFGPDEIVPRLYTIEMMDTPELNEFIETEKIRGSEDLNFYLIEKYKRVSYPAATFILVLIGVSVSSRKTRGGLGLNIAIGLLLSVVYIFFMQMSTTFASVGSMSPLLAVWLPNILFSFVAAYLYYIAPK